MTIQRITNHHSAPISACLRAFVLAAERGVALNSRPFSRTAYRAANGIGKLGMNAADMANACQGDKGSNAKSTQGNSATLRGSA